MKIEKSSKPLPATPVAGGRARASAVKPADGTQSSGATSVHLGATAEQLRSMESSIPNTPPINAAKVAEIKLAISEGRFQVNAGMVADGLIRSVTDLVSSHKA